MKDKLTKLVGQRVEVRAGDDCADSSGVYFSLYGKLELPEEGYHRFYLRIADTYGGCMGIGFTPDMVDDINIRGDGTVQILLKEHLPARVE